MTAISGKAASGVEFGAFILLAFALHLAALAAFAEPGGAGGGGSGGPVGAAGGGIQGGSADLAALVAAWDSAPETGAAPEMRQPPAEADATPDAMRTPADDLSRGTASDAPDLPPVTGQAARPEMAALPRLRTTEAPTRLAPRVPDAADASGRPVPAADPGESLPPRAPLSAPAAGPSLASPSGAPAASPLAAPSSGLSSPLSRAPRADAPAGREGRQDGEREGDRTGPENGAREPIGAPDSPPKEADADEDEDGRKDEGAAREAPGAAMAVPEPRPRSVKPRVEAAAAPVAEPALVAPKTALRQSAAGGAPRQSPPREPRVTSQSTPKAAPGAVRSAGRQPPAPGGAGRALGTPRGEGTGTGAEDSAGPGARRDALAAYGAAVLAAIARERHYPAMARRAGEEGTVGIVLTLTADGALIRAAVAQASGYGRLDEAALDAVRRVGQYPPRPEALGREPLSFQIPVRFDLR